MNGSKGVKDERDGGKESGVKADESESDRKPVSAKGRDTGKRG